MKYISTYGPSFDEIVRVKDLDTEVRASGYIKKELNKNISKF